MFGMFRKRDKKNGAKNAFQPSFGTEEDFKKRCAQKSNNVVVINDDKDDVDNKCVMSSVTQGNLSYIVYDPDGKYHNALAQKMKDREYDVQVLDFGNQEHKSRIDLFEIVNIARNPYWISVILSGSIKCAPDEVSIAYHLFMAMMQYLLDTKQKVNIDDMKDLFAKIVDEDKQTKRDIESNPVSKSSMMKVASAPTEVRASVFNKVEDKFFNRYYDKIAKPNVFTVTMHNKKTVLFVKKVPGKYKGLVTAMLFNLRASGVMCGDGALSTMLISASDDVWYNKTLFTKVCSESDLEYGHSIASMRIKTAIDLNTDLVNDPIIVYMHSQDAATKEYIFDALRVRNQMTESELADISAKHFRGKPINKSVLDSAPIAMEDLETMKDCIVIDPARNARPFRCAEWVVG